MTSISILGSGKMARGIGARAVAGGNKLQILDLDAQNAAALATELGGAASGTIGEPLLGDIVVLALPYKAVQPVVEQYGDRLNGKTIVDITNPIDTATFAGLVTPLGSSGAEEIAKAAAGAKVVKAFNTTFASTLEAGEVDGQPLDVFIAGDDAQAKAAVSEFVDSAGLRPIDVGDLSKAHWLEGLGYLHVGLQLSRGTNFSTGLKLTGA